MSKTTKENENSLYGAYVKPGIRSWKQQFPHIDDDHAFLMWATDLVLDDLDLPGEHIFDACRLDGKWDLKVDSAFIDRQGQKVYLIQAKHWQPRKSIGDNPFFEAWESLDLLSNPQLVRKANSVTREFYVEFCEAIRGHFELRLYVVTSGRILQPQRDYVAGKPKQRQIQIGDLHYEVPVIFTALGLPELVDIERQGEVAGSGGKDEFTTLNLSQGWYCVPKEGDGKNLYDSLYTTITAEEAVQIRKHLGPDAYKLNYRGPLGAVAVNKDIESTLKDIPQTFHILNNGLTAICDFFSVASNVQKVKIKGLQIVNGCQTMETLYRNNAILMGKSDVKVNLRLITCQRSQGGLVARATNNQTKLRAEDFATLDPIQEDLQSQFARLDPPWYYEIKRKFWKNIVSKNKVERQKFLDESNAPRMIKLRDASQRSLAFMGKPIIAAQDASLIFTEVEERGYKEYVFPQSLYAHQVLLAWKIYEYINNEIEVYLREIADPQEREGLRDWLEYGRLSIVALVGDALRENYNLKTLEYVSQSKSEELLSTLEQWLAPLAKAAIRCLCNVAKYNEGWKNIGPRATFRKSSTYELDVKPPFVTVFQTSRDLITALPK